jgi:3-mercaptopyruvate sulfurtransferase SseA
MFGAIAYWGSMLTALCVPRTGRSLKAVYYLQQAGVKAVHVQGGYSEWLRQGLPLNTDDDDSDADGAVPAEQQQVFKIPLFSR